MSSHKAEPRHASDRLPALTVSLLGPFNAAARTGAMSELPKKAQALLGFLIVNRGRTVSREEGAALLWSNTGAEQARQSLRQCLSVLRRSLPSDAAAALDVHKETLLLAKGPHIVSDVETFEQASRSETADELARADALYGGDLLLGLHIKHEPFDDWLTVERQRLSLAHLNVVERLARLRAEACDLPGAIEHARRLVALDRYREESSRLLMELLAASGQRGMALVEHARMERMLRDELGLAPDIATRALAERIKRGAAATSRSVGRGRSLASLGKPRVLVVPFANLARPRDHDGLAYAITQDVIIDLAGDRLLDVVAGDGLQPVRPSSGLSPETGESAYVVVGTIRHDGRRIRIVVQLTDGSTGQCLWSTRFEDAAEPLFPMQDRVCSQIAARLSHAIRSTEVERIRPQPAENLTVYQLCLRAAAFSRSGQHGNSAALRLLRQALARDGELGVAHALAARCYHVQRLMGWVSPDDRRLEEGIHHANAAVDLSCSDPEVLWMAGLAIMNISGDIPRGRSLIDQSLRMNPTSTNAWIASCFLHVHAGDGDTATKHFGEAERLNPFDMSHHVQQNAAATSYFVAEDFEAAYAASNACLAQRPGYTAGLRIKVASASLTGRVEEAQQAARELLALEPGASIARMRDYWKGLAPNAPQALDAKLYGWRRAGMPE